MPNAFKITSAVLLLSCISTTGAAVLTPASIAKKASASVPYSRQTLARQLGWVDAPGSCSLCEGYYQEPLLDFSQLGLITDNDSQIAADQVSISQQGRSVLRGNVVVKRPGKQLEASQASFTRDQKTGKISTIHLRDHVRIREPGKLLIAKRASINLDKNTAKIHHAIYRLARSNQQQKEGSLTQLYGTNVWGQASLMAQLAAHVYELQDATYTSCPPTRSGWKVKAKKARLDNNKQRIYMHHGVFTLYDVPVFYLPYISLSTDDKRATGFLFPTASYSSKLGASFGIPFYWNMAPNYDMTLFANYYTKRGVLLQDEFRYLNAFSTTQITASILPADRSFRAFRAGNPSIESWGNNRAMLSIHNRTSISPALSALISYDGVSDDYYFQDLRDNTSISTQQQLLQQMRLDYNTTHWQMIGNIQRYQTLHPIGQTAVADVYGRLPQLIINANYPRLWHGFDVRMNSEFVNFVWPGNPLNRISGLRLHLQPQISRPVIRPYGHFTPTVKLDLTQYNLIHQLPGFANNPNRVLPMISVDMGLVAQRKTQIWGKNYWQTLEPRAYYLYVPYENQDGLPLFDTGINIFTFNQLFRDNRFSGGDRVGDANQMTLALTSRWLDATSGAEKLRVSLGDIVYFRDRNVGFCTGVNCSNFTNGSALRYTSPSYRFSPIVGEAVFHLTPYWSTVGSLSYDPIDTRPNNASVNLHFQSDNSHILNISYNYQRSILKTNADGTNGLESTHLIGTSGVWPITKHWSLLGTWSYNLAYNHSQTTYFGTQYNSCCWAFRALGGRTLESVSNTFNPTYSTGVYFQILLKGLGAFAPSNPSDLLTREIPGYHDLFKDL